MVWYSFILWTYLFLVNADVLAETILYAVLNVDIVSLFVFGSITHLSAPHLCAIICFLNY